MPTGNDMVPLLLFLILLVLSWPILLAVLAFNPPLIFGLVIAALGITAIAAPTVFRDQKGSPRKDRRRTDYFGYPDQWKVPPPDDHREG
jgi:hypothetical protein